MFCSKCGEENTATALFCTNCGEAITKNNNITTPETGNTQSNFSEESLEDYYREAIGYKNTDYYLSIFKKLDSGDTNISWNWPAFFVTFYWFLYRKMWLWALIYFLLPIPVSIVIAISAAVSQSVAIVSLVGFYIGIFIIFPMYANKIYHQHVRKKIEKAKGFSNEKEKQLRVIASEGGTSNVALIVVLIFAFISIIGILAAIAIPAYQDYTIRAKISQGLTYGSQYKSKIEEYAVQNQEWPQSNEDINISDDISDPNILGIYVQNGALIIQYAGSRPIHGKYLALIPSVNDENYIVWECKSDGIHNKYLPPVCRSK